MTAYLYGGLSANNPECSIPGAFSPVVQKLTAYEVSDSEDSLLKTIHQELIVENFRDPNDVDTYEGLKHYVSSRENNESQRIRYHVIAALDGSQVAGATIFAFFGCPTYCFMKGEYTVVRPAFRRQGIAPWLGNARSIIAARDAVDLGYRNGVDFSILTSNRSESASLPDLERSPWRRMGFRIIDFPLVQLPLWEGGGSCDEIRLGFKGHTPIFTNCTFLRSDEMRDIINAVNYFRDTTFRNEQHPRYRAMLKMFNAEVRFALL